MINKSLVSIAIPCYNHADFIQESILSVIDQDYTDIELIIIDDGSTDNSVLKIQELISVCRERFIRFEFRHRSNKGVGETLNEMLDWCGGQYFAALASDDLIKVNKTTIQVNYLNSHDDVMGVFGGIEILHNDGKTVEEVSGECRYSFNEILLHSHNLPAPTQLLRMSKVKEVGGFRKDLIIEDWSMWLLMTQDGGYLVYLNELFASYRRHDSNISSQLEKMHQGRLEVLNLFKNNSLYSLAKSNVLLIRALEVQKFKKIGSIEYLALSIYCNLRILFTKNFLVYMYRFFFK